MAALGGIIMTAWDVAMDPMMVSGGNWVWEVQGAYFGVPLQNFWGWWLTTLVALLIYQAAANSFTAQRSSVPDRWAVWIYLITAASTIAVDLLVGLGGPALAGIFSMFPWDCCTLLPFIKTKERTAWRQPRSKKVGSYLFALKLGSNPLKYKKEAE